MLPDRAPTGIVRVIAVEEIDIGVIFTPFNFTLRIELNPVPLIVTEVNAGPLIADNPPDALIRGNAETVGVLIL